MPNEHLPKVSELPRPVARSVMLGSIGSLLRARYDDVARRPLSGKLQTLVRQLARAA